MRAGDDMSSDYNAQRCLSFVDAVFHGARFMVDRLRSLVAEAGSRQWQKSAEREQKSDESEQKDAARKWSFLCQKV